MVALHNGRLTQRDIFPDLPWTDEDWSRKQKAFHDQILADGIAEPEASFLASKEMEDFASQFPGFRARQKIMAAIAPRTTSPASIPFSPQEIDWLKERLTGSNDPIGQGILAKLEQINLSQPQD